MDGSKYEIGEADCENNVSIYVSYVWCDLSMHAMLESCSALNALMLQHNLHPLPLQCDYDHSLWLMVEHHHAPKITTPQTNQGKTTSKRQTNPRVVTKFLRANAS